MAQFKNFFTKSLHQLEGRPQAIRILLSVGTTIFLVEGLIMMFLSYWPIPQPFLETLIDSTLLVALSSPILYFMLFRPLLGYMNSQMDSLHATSLNISTQSDEILSIVKSQGNGMSRTATSLQDFTSTLEELAKTAKQITFLAKEIANISTLANQIARTGADTLDSSQKAMKSIQQSTSSITERIINLSERSKEIGVILDIIENIADKTEILSLNAALEGTRAGEAGRGFSLVAKEMRRLSERVSESTAKIKDVTRDIQTAISACVVATEDGVKTTKSGIETLEGTTQNFGQIFEIVEAIHDSSNQISLATQQQNSATEQTVASINEITQVVSQNTMGIQEIQLSLGELNKISKELQEIIATYQRKNAGTQKI